MKIENKSKHTILTERFMICKTMLEQARGLMFRRQADLLFEFSCTKKVPLHMFFVFYPIDIIYMDEEMKIVELKENFRPFTFYNPKRPAKYLLELKKGTILSSNSGIGDKIIINKFK